ncbi:hypothetical protein [Rhizobium sullae]|uniref:hypothetical protein n=1 Tax=Rhizobium sullae TaxID=50338 RepID=UPI0035D03543
MQIVRHWVVRFNARGPDGLINGKAPGKPTINVRPWHKPSSVVPRPISMGRALASVRSGQMALGGIPCLGLDGLHLIEISRNVAHDAHAIPIMDQRVGSRPTI